ncbi:hypothetical protein [Escherichia coli]|uniref:tail fiber/spike domain-containing protein n=1 Tax=Escherichia coli TaxID=562 RepID=UPI0021C91065|nr:hypothetical protein [Escherichia coli]MCQ6539898.1 hypothetical protein [Escherichia coli]
MTIIKRADLGRPLTWDELDDNFQQVDDLTAAASAAVSSAAASATAAAGSAANSLNSANSAAASAANASAALVSAVKRTITFTTGGTLNSNLDRISDGTYLYYWTGSYPVTVPANSTVDGTGGIAVGYWAVDNDLLLRESLSSDEGTTNVAKLGNKPLVAISYYKNQGLSDQDAVQAAFDESSNITFDVNVTLTSAIAFDRSEPCTVIFSPGITVTNTNFLPRMITHPNHKISGTTFRTKQYSAVNSDGTSVTHQAMAVEMAVHDTLSSGPSYEPFVALMAGIESFNCERQKLWAMNLLTNAHNLQPGDEVYGVEIDCNIDGDVGNGTYVGCYIAGIGDLSTSSGADGIRVQRLRNGVDKWNCGIRIFDSVTGLSITDAATYSIFASGDAPIVRRKTTQNGSWSYIHQISASVTPWGVDDYGDTYSRRLYLGTGDGKSKNRVNLDGGVKFYTTNAAVSWGAIPVNGYVDKDVTTLFGISIADWTNYTLDVTPFGYSGAMPVVAVQVYISSDKTQAHVRIINISGSALSACNVGLNAKLCGHSSTN